MLHTVYNNFVRPTSPVETEKEVTAISGDEAKTFYLEEVDQVEENNDSSGNEEKDDSSENEEYDTTQKVSSNKHKTKSEDIDISNLKLFTCIQDNNVDILRRILDACPDKIRTVDEHGWSLLMIACQANASNTVKELLKRGADTTVQDKAGNSAQSLIILNKNSYIADILLSHVTKRNQCNESNTIVKQTKHKTRHKEKYVCELCDGKSFHSRKEHLSSTLHNINASKGRKIRTNYVIPQSNKGYQIMLKTGWDKEAGLGPDGSGSKYPIKTVPKNDKKGLGHEKKRLKTSNEESPKQQNNKHLENAYERNRRMEINFRREFY
ncbi:G patch domain and ankyrin repeat-containing protein 1 homolog [Pararge aegeria]|uniref:G patch domain and ankyrin repeat-containing protein 1 homolog n=1 Tax=Pararge aegeria TaxID=116150 RepID=UPI0019CFCC8C|nr:G patch domain and ankyrin repeat-containing protein 1 homolog [Pararge aegeria]